MRSDVADLIARGFNPLPAQGKGCYTPGWPALNTTVAWAEKAFSPTDNIGIRCDRLVAIDVDILNEALADKIDGCITRALGRTDWCRAGRWPKRLLLYRLDEGAAPVPYLATHRFKTAEGDCRVEVLSGPGRLFISQGTHPSGVSYQWEGDATPLTHSRESIPVVLQEDVENLIDTLNNEFIALGMTPARVEKEVINAELTDDMVFEIAGHGFLSVAEIKERLPRGEEWWCNLTALRPDSDSRAGHLFWCDYTDALVLHDFPRGVTYRSSRASVEERANALTQSASRISGTFPEEQTPQAPPLDSLAALLSDWAFVMFDNGVRRLDDPTRSYSVEAFVRMYSTPHVTPTGRAVAVGAQWLIEPQTIKAHLAQLRPDRGPGVVTEDALTILNTYDPPQHDATGGSATLFWEFLEYLIPKENERALFIDWLATKMQNPWLRMHALIMVTPTYGTGRGTLSEIIAKLVGIRYFTETTLSHLTGRDSQGQYTDFLSGSLIVSIPEAYDTSEDSNRWANRKASYERLKQVADTATRPQLIKTKFGRNATEMVFASLLIATQHYDALAIEPHDRRMIVIDNCLTPLASLPLCEAIHDWKESPANIAAVYHALKTRVIAYDPFGMPPETPAKRRMISAGRSDLDQAWDVFSAQCAGGIVCLDQWRNYVNKNRELNGWELPEAGKLEKALTAILSSKTLSLDTLERIRVGDSRIRPRSIRDHDRWSAAGIDEVRQELGRNGPIRNPLSLGGVALPEKAS